LQTANGIACSTIGSCLDYCNSLLARTSAHNIARLQEPHNIAVKVVCRARRYASGNYVGLPTALATCAAAYQLQNRTAD